MTAPERQAIREAMGRLLEGQPIRSDGKLTSKSLADEADVKRWILTRRHQDPQEEFRARVARHCSDAEPVRRLKDAVADLKQENQRLRAELREAKTTTSMLERLVAVEAHTTPRPGAPLGPPILRPVT